MPPKSKRKLQLKNARESKRTKLLGAVSSTETAEEAVESENETVDGEESFLSFCERVSTVPVTMRTMKKLQKSWMKILPFICMQ